MVSLSVKDRSTVVEVSIRNPTALASIASMRVQLGFL
jgi:hypothetical protein